MSGFFGFLTGPDKEDRDRIEKATKEGKVQDASQFNTQAKRDALMQVVKADNRNKGGSGGAFEAAQAEQDRRQGGYHGSPADKSTSTANSQMQTGTPATHKDGNY